MKIADILSNLKYIAESTILQHDFITANSGDTTYKVSLQFTYAPCFKTGDVVTCTGNFSGTGYELIYVNAKEFKIKDVALTSSSWNKTGKAEIPAEVSTFYYDYFENRKAKLVVTDFTTLILQPINEKKPINVANSINQYECTAALVCQNLNYENKSMNQDQITNCHFHLSELAQAIFTNLAAIGGTPGIPKEFEILDNGNKRIIETSPSIKYFGNTVEIEIKFNIKIFDCAIYTYANNPIPYIKYFTNLNTDTILKTVHLQGNIPKIDIYELVSGSYVKCQFIYTSISSTGTVYWDSLKTFSGAIVISFDNIILP